MRIAIALAALLLGRTAPQEEGLFQDRTDFIPDPEHPSTRDFPATKEK